MVTQAEISLNQPNDVKQGIVAVEPLFLSPKNSAKFLGISRSLLYSMHKSGQLGPEPIKISEGRTVWWLEELRAWAKAGFPYRQEWQKHESFQGNIQN